MRTIVPSLLLGSLVFVMILYLNASHSELLGNMKYILTGSKAMASIESDPDLSEKRRIERIRSMLISDRNKKDLIEGRPFWGAAQHMLELAFGAPADNSMVRVRNGMVYEFHTFDVEPEPVVFEFQDNKLACAHYASNQRSICDDERASFYKDSAALFSSTSAAAVR
ncbi:MAG: hypothetical protein MRY32_04590 [Rickettsiales bacterium]|nr:hypothetical protein [Rickettsiales bacterium]